VSLFINPYINIGFSFNQEEQRHKDHPMGQLISPLSPSAEDHTVAGWRFYDYSQNTPPSATATEYGQFSPEGGFLSANNLLPELDIQKQLKMAEDEDAKLFLLERTGQNTEQGGDEQHQLIGLVNMVGLLLF
jgi:hypothetical protein